MLVYKIINKINGKIYVGQTVRSLDVELKEVYELPKPYAPKATIGISVSNTNSTMYIKHQGAGKSLGFSRSGIYRALKSGRPYKGYIWGDYSKWVK